MFSHGALDILIYSLIHECMSIKFTIEKIGDSYEFRPFIPSEIDGDLRNLLEEFYQSR